MTFTGAAAVAGVAGWPIAHSRSPAIHNYWLEKHGIDGIYVPLAVPPESFERAVRTLPCLGFKGVNVTAPHKEAAFWAMDETDPLSARTGAVNTIVVRADGSLRGENSDVSGFLEALKEGNPGWRGGDGPAVVVGAGGAARAVVAALEDSGAPEIRLVNRTPERAAALAAGAGPVVEPRAWEARTEALDGAALLVNTTPLGMAGRPALDLELSRLPAEATVCDIVYAPLETPLLAVARARGNVVVDGLGMLLHQARPGFRAWFGRDPVVDAGLRRRVLADPGAS